MTPWRSPSTRRCSLIGPGRDHQRSTVVVRPRAAGQRRRPNHQVADIRDRPKRRYNEPQRHQRSRTRQICWSSAPAIAARPRSARRQIDWNQRETLCSISAAMCSRPRSIRISAVSSSVGTRSVAYDRKIVDRCVLRQLRVHHHCCRVAMAQQVAVDGGIRLPVKQCRCASGCSRCRSSCGTSCTVAPRSRARRCACSCARWSSACGRAAQPRVLRRGSG